MFSRFCCIHFHRLILYCASFLDLRPVAVWGARIAASTLHTQRALTLLRVFSLLPSLLFNLPPSPQFALFLPFCTALFRVSLPFYELGRFHRSNALFSDLIQNA